MGAAGGWTGFEVAAGLVAVWLSASVGRCSITSHSGSGSILYRGVVAAGVVLSASIISLTEVGLRVAFHRRTAETSELGSPAAWASVAVATAEDCTAWVVGNEAVGAISGAEGVSTNTATTTAAATAARAAIRWVHKGTTGALREVAARGFSPRRCISATMSSYSPSGTSAS